MCLLSVAIAGLYVYMGWCLFFTIHTHTYISTYCIAASVYVCCVCLLCMCYICVSIFHYTYISLRIVLVQVYICIHVPAACVCVCICYICIHVPAVYACVCVCMCIYSCALCWKGRRLELGWHGRDPWTAGTSGSPPRSLCLCVGRYGDLSFLPWFPFYTNTRTPTVTNTQNAYTSRTSWALCMLVVCHSAYITYTRCVAFFDFCVIITPRILLLTLSCANMIDAWRKVGSVSLIFPLLWTMWIYIVFSDSQSVKWQFVCWIFLWCELANMIQMYGSVDRSTYIRMFYLYFYILYC